SQARAWLRTIAVGVWFGIAAGLAERTAYRFRPAYLGAVELWYSALLDLCAFTALAGVAILISLVLRRLRSEATAVVFCSFLLAIDFVTIVLPPYHKLVSLILAFAAATLLTVLIGRYDLINTRAARLMLAAAVIYVA